MRDNTRYMIFDLFCHCTSCAAILNFKHIIFTMYLIETVIILRYRHCFTATVFKTEKKNYIAANHFQKVRIIMQQGLR